MSRRLSILQSPPPGIHWLYEIGKACGTRMPIAFARNASAESRCSFRAENSLWRAGRDSKKMLTGCARTCEPFVSYLETINPPSDATGERCDVFNQEHSVLCEEFANCQAAFDGRNVCGKIAADFFLAFSAKFALFRHGRMPQNTAAQLSYTARVYDFSRIAKRQCMPAPTKRASTSGKEALRKHE